jgi:hypothetical protein
MAAECPDDTIVDEVQRVFGELQVPTSLDELITDAVRGYAAAVGWPEADVATALPAIEVVTGAIAVRSEDQAPPPFGFVRLGPDIAHPAIEPLPSADARPRGDDKLYGTRLLHFGAFGAEHWRRWDFTWGRLDAAAHLARLFDGSADTGPLEMQILTEEGLPLAEVQQELRQIDEQLTAHAGKQDRPLLDKLRRDPTCRDTLPDLADSVMRFLAQDDDRLHTPVLSTAGYVRAVLQDERPPGLTVKQRVLRLALRRYRRRAWRWLSGVDPSASASSSTPSGS